MNARLLIAGVSSGVGKTSFTVGLCAALRRRGLGVRVFKCGPDYLDPTYHRVASGQAVHNLDGWLMGEPALRATFERNAGEISLIEGVMGLFDGASPSALTGSSAEVALWLGAPVVLVCDASGMARSVAALAHGFASFEPKLNVAGLICNRVGSRGHLALLEQANVTPPVLGGLPKKAAPSFPERHLGLHTARELDLSAAIAAWAEQVESWCDVDALLALARSAPALGATAPALGAAAPALGVAPRHRCRIGVADDAAFHFYYESNLHLLERAGAELVRFSPLSDPSCGDLDGIYIGGGYPELYAHELSQNQTMLDSLRRHAASGRPLYAECGGLMYLSDAITTLGGERYPMLGLVEGSALMQSSLVALGYVEVETREPCLLGPAGTRFRGHQFRYSRFETTRAPTSYQVNVLRTGASLDEGYGGNNVLGSYVHAHWAGSPQIPEFLVARCAAAAAGRGAARS
jgi:cobyrinic acid a,c-diamide synthase